MHSRSSPSPRHIPSTSNTKFLRKVARRMLRDVHSDQPSRAMPAIRRVHQARILPAGRLTELYHARAALQLKHMLRTIAVELGFPNWEACKREIDHRPPGMLDRFRLDLGAFGDYNQVWFSNEAAAQQWQKENGGHVVVYGSQAVVMTP